MRNELLCDSSTLTVAQADLVGVEVDQLDPAARNDEHAAILFIKTCLYGSQSYGEGTYLDTFTSRCKKPRR